jgi:hypothetical protein
MWGRADLRLPPWEPFSLGSGCQPSTTSWPIAVKPSIDWGLVAGMSREKAGSRQWGIGNRNSEKRARTERTENRKTRAQKNQSTEKPENRKTRAQSSLFSMRSAPCSVQSLLEERCFPEMVRLTSPARYFWLKPGIKSFDYRIAGESASCCGVNLAVQRGLGFGFLQMFGQR